MWLYEARTSKRHRGTSLIRNCSPLSTTKGA
jgi:hypothetical protein